jgi:enamine deaminase RidA (YjgF/YER057c/UK114 family)
MLITAFAAQAAEPTPIKRHYLGKWEQEIGYAGVSQVGNTLHISGVACGGETMQAAVTACYRELGDILKKFGATPDRIVKENIYTTDIEALKKCIPSRKNFFNNTNYPAATWVQVSRLFGAEHLLEVEVTVEL